MLSVVGRFRRLAVALSATLLLGVVLVSSGHAQAAPAILEVSNSCAVRGTTTQLTIWGSRVPAGGGTLSDTQNQFSMPEPAGNFTATVPSYTPPNVGTDVVELITNPTVPAAATRNILVELPPRQAPCPSTAPGPTPCLTPGQPVPVSVTGLVPFLGDNGAPVTLNDTTWFLDYRGTNALQPFFATSPTVNNAASATLPGKQATPGAHMVTALSQPAPIVAGPPPNPPFALGPDDVYTTFLITICQPPPPTTTTTVHGTVPPTTPTTPGQTTTTTAAPTTPTTIPPGVFLPPTTTPPVTAPPGSPTLAVDPNVGYGGEVTQVHGSGFPPNTVVRLEWLPGIGTVTARVAADGTFTVGMLVFPHDEIGVRLVHAQGFPATVSATFLDELGPEGPPAASNGEWIFRQG
jgi:hypothetical protein